MQTKTRKKAVNNGLDDERTSPKSVGKRLCQAREEIHLSQEDFAGQVNISRNQLANYESGRTPLPTGIALKICRHFVIGELWLATGYSYPWSVVDLLSEPEAQECDPNISFSKIFGNRFIAKFHMLNDWKESALTFRERYERLLKTAKGDKNRLWFILLRLIRQPSTISTNALPGEDADDLADFYEKIITLCLQYEIRWSGGVERELKEIRERQTAKIAFEKEQEKALDWMKKNPRKVGSDQWWNKMREIFLHTGSTASDAYKNHLKKMI